MSNERRRRELEVLSAAEIERCFDLDHALRHAQGLVERATREA